MGDQNSFSRLLKLVGLSSCLILLFFEGVYESIIAPIYPLRAINHHETSQAIVGYTLAMFPFGQTAIAILLLIFDINNYIRNVFIFASTSSALGIAAFGLADSIENNVIYQVISTLSRFVTGVSTGAVFTVIFAIVTNYFGKLGGKVSNAFVPFFYTGITVGPQISLFLSTSFQYSTPFYICGALGLIFVVTSSTMFFHNENRKCTENHTERINFSFFEYTCDRGVIALLLNLFCILATYGFFDGILAQFFIEEIGANSFQLNIVYAIVSIPLLPSSFFFGWYLAKKGHGFLVMFSCIALNSLATFFIYLGNYFFIFKQFYVVSFMIFFAYTARSTVIAVTFPVLAIYTQKRFPESNPIKINVFVGSAFVIMANAGQTSGPAFFIGFFESTLWHLHKHSWNVHFNPLLLP